MTDAVEISSPISILVAEDEVIARKVITDLLSGWGYNAVIAEDGLQAWEKLEEMSGPCIALIDRRMPGMDGSELCKKIRESDVSDNVYIIMVTGMKSSEEIVEGLKSGADDYITKPFDEEELHVRIEIGVRLVILQLDLIQRVKELEVAKKHVAQLQDLMPICARCKKIRDHENYWHQVESYMSKHAEMQFTHSFCPTCTEAIMREYDEEEKAAQ